MTEGKRQRIEDRKQITDDGRQITEGFDFGIRNEECGMKQRAACEAEKLKALNRRNKDQLRIRN